MSNFGAVYVARNPKDPDGVFKVGKTTRSVDQRLAGLTAETSNLGQYEAIGYVVVTDVDAAEAETHKRLSRHRVQENREFFSAPLGTIIRTIRAATEPYLVKGLIRESSG